MSTYNYNMYTYILCIYIYMYTYMFIHVGYFQVASECFTYIFTFNFAWLQATTALEQTMRRDGMACRKPWVNGFVIGYHQTS